MCAARVSFHGWFAIRRQLVLELRRQMVAFHLSPDKNIFFPSWLFVQQREKIVCSQLMLSFVVV